MEALTTRLGELRLKFCIITYFLLKMTLSRPFSPTGSNNGTNLNGCQLVDSVAADNGRDNHVDKSPPYILYEH